MVTIFVISFSKNTHCGIFLSHHPESLRVPVKSPNVASFETLPLFFFKIGSPLLNINIFFPSFFHLIISNVQGYFSGWSDSSNPIIFCHTLQNRRILMCEIIELLPLLLPDRAAWMIRCYYSWFLRQHTWQKLTRRRRHQRGCCQCPSTWLCMSNAASHLLHLKLHCGPLFIKLYIRREKKNAEKNSCWEHESVMLGFSELIVSKNMLSQASQLPLAKHSHKITLHWLICPSAVSSTIWPLYRNIHFLLHIVET